MIQQLEDLRAEVAELASILAPLSPADWERVTQFKGYTINDVVRHLHQGDWLATESALRPETFGAILAERRTRRAEGLSPRDDARRQFGHLSDKALLAAWRSALDALVAQLSTLGPDARLKWSGPDMGLRMFATARQMEVWAHGHEIADCLGIARAPTNRLQNIAVIGVRTFGWTFVNRKLPPPPHAPRVILSAPSGERWAWHEDAPPEAGSVEGDALEFCQVVTQVRNVADTSLRITGDTAGRWMAIAQCFAGPPEDPPAPGTRRLAASQS